MDTLTLSTPDSSLWDKVTFGASELDRIQPDWYRKIDLGKLNMRNESSCILGQIFGAFYKGLVTNYWTDDDARLRGFLSTCDSPDADACSCGPIYQTLYELWSAAVLDRHVSELGY